MRNLYKRLKVSPSASLDVVRDAIKKCGHAGLKKDSETILLNESKRKAYDKVHREVVKIGILRSRLGLTHTDNWTGDAVNDFASPSESARSLHDEFLEKLKPSIINKVVSSLKNFVLVTFKALTFLLIVFGIFWIIGQLTSSGTNETSHSRPDRLVPASIKPVENAFKLSMPLPHNGAVRTFTDQRNEAPFKVVTSSGSNYLVKLVNALSGKTVLDVFIRGGNTVSIDVPLGRYIVKYASGSEWYGYEQYFGPNTGYSKANTIFNFKVQGNQISGYTITLYRVTNGNLKTSSIKASDF